MHTAEFVSAKHPDKMCDQISDAILDWCLGEDKNARVAVEVMGGHGKVFIAGEITMKGGHMLAMGIKNIVERVTGRKELEIESNIVTQSPEIAKGVDTGGAGDQGIMRGYAVRDTEELMPLEYSLAKDLNDYIFEEFPYDGKTQVTINDAMAVTAIVASFQYAGKTTLEEMVRDWIEDRGAKIKVADDLKIYANPAGDWQMGGFDADTGLTGRKLMVDNYGPRYPIGGGAFSGKDATKVDRSAAYIARKIAVEILSEKPELYDVAVEIAYAIGVAEPVALNITGTKMNGMKVKIEEAVNHDLTPNGIIEELKLRDPIFEETARGGHFGRGFNWK